MNKIVIFTQRKDYALIVGKKYEVLDYDMLHNHLTDEIIMEHYLLCNEEQEHIWYESKYFDDKNVLRELKLKRIIDG